MQKVMSFSAGRLKTGKILFFLTAFLMWLALLLGPSILWLVMIFQIVWVFFSSVFSIYIVGNTEEYQEFNNRGLALWLLNFWLTVSAALWFWGIAWGVGVFVAMMALIMLGSLPAFFLGSRYNKSTGVDFPIGFGN